MEGKRSRLRPGWRKLTWAIVVWSALFAFLFAAALVTSWLESGCTERFCEDESATDVAVLAILFTWWLLGFGVLGALWLVKPLRERRRRS